MKRVAIYARYSSDRQSETSAEDQARLCRERAAREGWEVAGTFLDEAMSGATRNRPQLNHMLARAAEFDIVLAESLDRLSRDQEDIAAIHKRLRFAGVEIVTLADGAISGLLLGVKGAMAAEYLQDLGQKTRRGQIGRVHAGRIPGGLSYGYDKVHALDAKGEPERGLRRINEAQAEIVRRIFREYVSGISPREIAKRLNADGVEPPRGEFWRANTIIGHRTRRNGILNNDLYAGKIVFNRQSFVRDPDTRKRVSRPNPPGDWITREVPELRIVDQETWEGADKHVHRGNRTFHKAKRPKHLFSGLAACGHCGGSLTIIHRDKWGCARQHEAGLCDNRRMLRNDILERRVLAGLRDRLLAPDLIDAYVQAYHEQAVVAAQEHKRSKEALRRSLREAEAKVKRLATAIANGADVVEVRDVLKDAAAKRDLLRAEMDEIEAAKIVPLKPRLAETYRRRIADLTAALNGDGVHRAEAKLALRSMIEQIVVYPSLRPPFKRDGSDFEIELQGRLAQIIAASKKMTPAHLARVDFRTIKAVAGARSRLVSALAVVRV